MTVQPVGYVAYPQTNVQQKKSRGSAVALGTGLSAAVGAGFGYQIGGQPFQARMKDLSAKLANENLLKNSLKDHFIQSGYATEATFENVWQTRKNSYINDAKKALEEVTKNIKKSKAVWAVGCGAIAGIIGLMLAKSSAKRADNIGKVDKVKDSSTVSHVVTTPSGKQIAVPVTLGGTTKIRPLMDGKYEVMTKATTPDAKWEVQKLTEQELINKYSNWIIKT